MISKEIADSISVPREIVGLIEFEFGVESFDGIVKHTKLPSERKENLE